MKRLALVHYVKEFGYIMKVVGSHWIVLSKEMRWLDLFLEGSLLSVWGMYWKEHSEMWRRLLRYFRNEIVKDWTKALELKKKNELEKYRGNIKSLEPSGNFDVRWEIFVACILGFRFKDLGRWQCQDEIFFSPFISWVTLSKLHELTLSQGFDHWNGNNNSAYFRILWKLNELIFIYVRHIVSPSLQGFVEYIDWYMSNLDFSGMYKC